MLGSGVWEGAQEHGDEAVDCGVVGAVEVKGRSGNLSRPTKRFGKKARTKMAMKRRDEVVEDG